MKPSTEFNRLHDLYRVKLPPRRSEAESAFCDLHMYQIRTIPLAKHRYYPESIDLDTVWEKIIGTPWIQKRVRELYDRPNESRIFRKHRALIEKEGKLRWKKMLREPNFVEDATPG